MKKNKLKFNILDVSIIAAILFLIVGTFVKLQFGTKSQGGTVENATAVISVEVTDTQKTLSKAIERGDSIKILGNFKSIGKITSVVNRNNKSYVINGDKYEQIITHDLYRVLIRFEADVYKNENGLFTKDNNYLAPGLVLDFETDNAVFQGTISSISFK